MPRSSVQATFRPHATTPAHPAFSRLSRTVRSADGARQDEPEAQASESLKTGLDRGFAQSANDIRPICPISRITHGTYETDETDVDRKEGQLLIKTLKTSQQPSQRPLPIRIHSHRVQSLALRACLFITLTAATAHAGEPSRPGYYHPLNQFESPGTIAQWAVQLGKASPNDRQPVKVNLPSKGRVTVFTSPNPRSNAQPHDFDAPAQVGLAVGFVYRLKISHMPEFPGVELYPSVEMIDRLHPPAGKEDEFPIPIAISEDEVRYVLDGRYITKIIYLEQPQLASHFDAENPDAVVELRRSVNLLTEADRRGRPMVILRIGGRVPPLNGNRRAFFRPDSPVWLTQPAKSPAPVPNATNPNTGNTKAP